MRHESLPTEPVTLVLYEDPLSTWCWIAERRIAAALEHLPGLFGPLAHAPFPLRVEPAAFTRAERRALARTARTAAREPDAAGIEPALWLSPDAPRTSVPPLAALVAARLQGAAREDALRAAIREAALVRGLDVSRADVLLELAERSGLDLTRFAPAFSSRRTLEHVRAGREDAVDKGIEEIPALVIGDEWLVTGARSSEEYVDVLKRYATVRLGIPEERTLH